MIARLRNAYRDTWSPRASLASSEARASGLLVMLISTGATFVYIGLMTSTPLSLLANGEALELFFLPAMAGVCLAAQGGYRAVVGTGLRGDSVGASAARITIALAALFLALATVVALFVAARSLRRERLPDASPPAAVDYPPP